MTPELQHLLVTYGYWLMAFGAIIEGETFLIAGGVAAHQGLFHLEGLILLALVGSTLHDVFFFLLGRYGGHEFVKRRPQLYAKVEGTLATFEKYGVLLIIALRFAYGFRTVIPTVLGMSHISFRKFLFFDIIGGVIWSCTFILGGYFFGMVISQIFSAFDIYSEAGFYVLIGAAIIFAGLIYAFFKHRAKRKGKTIDLNITESNDTPRK